MRTILILAAGIWIGREIFTTRAANLERELKVKTKKNLERFIKENLTHLDPAQMQRVIDPLIE